MKFNEKNSFSRVIKALPGDIGKGVARIPLEDMTRLSTTLGDVVEIKGEQSTVAKVVPLPQEYQKERVIQIDGTIRRNANVGLWECLITLPYFLGNSDYSLVFS